MSSTKAHSNGLNPCWTVIELVRFRIFNIKMKWVIPFELDRFLELNERKTSNMNDF